MKLINGKELAEQVKDGIAAEIFQSKKRPNLAIILVGEQPDSELYVKIKEREAKKVGIDTHLYRLEADSSQQELLSVIDFLNQDPLIDGILLQLPLPEHLDADAAVKAIKPGKDIDGFNPENLQHLTEVDQPNRLLPPVFLGVLMCLSSLGLSWEEQAVAIVGKDSIFRQSLARLLAALGAKIVELGADDPQLAAKTSQADILITAVGQAAYLSSQHIKPGAILIDIGISQGEHGPVGDVDQDQAGQAGWLTPVPGGIGPLTVAFALQNTLNAHNQQHPND